MEPGRGDQLRPQSTRLGYWPYHCMEQKDDESLTQNRINTVKQMKDRHTNISPKVSCLEDFDAQIRLDFSHQFHGVIECEMSILRHHVSRRRRLEVSRQTKPLALSSVAIVLPFSFLGIGDRGLGRTGRVALTRLR